jgi:hypothetical protein
VISESLCLRGDYAVAHHRDAETQGYAEKNSND